MLATSAACLHRLVLRGLVGGEAARGGAVPAAGPLAHPGRRGGWAGGSPAPRIAWRSVLLATAAPNFGPQRDGRWEVDPSRPADFVAFVESALSAEVGCRGIVYLWGLDAGEGTGVGPVEASRTPCRARCSSRRRQLGRRATEGAPLWLVTRGAQSVRPDEPVSLPQTALWGIARTAALEIPNVRWRRVDLEAGASGAEELLSELSRPDSEDQIAYRGGRRLVARLVRAEAVQGGIADAAEGQGLQLQIPTRGVLDNLAIMPVDRRPPGRGRSRSRSRRRG